MNINDFNELFIKNFRYYRKSLICTAGIEIQETMLLDSLVKS